MFLKERQEEIINLLNAEGRVTVPNLAQRFDVSEDCIRKDLKQLDREGRCTRVYGGAIPVEEKPDISVYHRLNTRVEQKSLIAERAYREIQDGETVFLDVSTTNLHLAELLGEGDKQCIVVSNIIDLLQTLAKNPKLTVISTGGNVNLELNGFVGASTVGFLESMYFDKAFIGALGIDAKKGCASTFEIDDGLVKKTVIENSKHRFLLVDSSKFGVMGNYRFANVSQFDGIITESVDADVASAIEAAGGTLLN